MEGSLSEGFPPVSDSSSSSQNGPYPLSRSSSKSIANSKDKILEPEIKLDVKTLDFKADVDITRCKLCTERMDIGRRTPKVLNCLHSFCQVCLEKVWQINNQADIICPICRTPTAIGKESGLSGLTSDFNVIRAMDLNNLLGDRTFCDECNENRGTKAVYRCLECKVYLCDVHCTAHKLGKRTFGHPLLTVEEAKRSQEAVVALGVRPMCKVQGHERQETILYCETCDKVICLACTLVDHVRPDHKYDYASKAIKHCKEEVNEILTKSKSIISNLSNGLNAVNETQKRTSQRNIELQELIKKSFDLLRQELTAREEALFAELDALTIKKENTLVNQEKNFI